MSISFWLCTGTLIFSIVALLINNADRISIKKARYEDEKVMQALHCCSRRDPYCKKCPLYRNKEGCVVVLTKSALQLIKRLKKEDQNE